MKKIIIPLLLLICGACYSQQTPPKQLLKTYFRVHPFNMKFSTFILNLQKDPWFTIQQLERRTDTTFFYLRGSYKNFNPFHYNPAQIELIIAEQEIVHVDSLHTRDTVVNLQLRAFTDTSSINKVGAAKEFKRFHNNHAENFYNSKYNKIVRGVKIIAEVENYFVYPLSIPPVTVAWGIEQETSHCVFAITVRFKLKENLAYPITAPWEMFNDPVE